MSDYRLDESDADHANGLARHNRQRADNGQPPLTQDELWREQAFLDQLERD